MNMVDWGYVYGQRPSCSGEQNGSLFYHRLVSTRQVGWVLGITLTIYYSMRIACHSQGRLPDTIVEPCGTIEIKFTPSGVYSSTAASPPPQYLQLRLLFCPMLQVSEGWGDISSFVSWSNQKDPLCTVQSIVLCPTATRHVKTEECQMLVAIGFWLRGWCVSSLWILDCIAIGYFLHYLYTMTQ